MEVDEGVKEEPEVDTDEVNVSCGSACLVKLTLLAGCSSSTVSELVMMSLAAKRLRAALSASPSALFVVKKSLSKVCAVSLHCRVAIQMRILIAMFAVVALLRCIV